MIGQPKFKHEDQVSFRFTAGGEEKTLAGVIYVVDAFGTIEQQEEPSYDIEALVEGRAVLFKHIPESDVTERRD